MIKYNHTPSVINHRPMTWLALCLRCGVTFFLYMCTAIVIYAKKIELSKFSKKGKFYTLVNYWLYEFLNQWNWTAVKKWGTYYAVKGVYIDGINKNLRMHRLILKATNPNQLIDHADGDGLNNTLANIRFCTSSQNQKNRHKKITASSQYLGVSKKLQYKTYFWGMQIKIGNGGMVSKQFPFTIEGEIQAAKAYDELAKIYHKEFANLNFKENE